MAIRKILYVLAVLIVLVGGSQVAFASWWLDRLPGLVDSPSFYLWGLPGILFGVVLLIGVLERAVGLRLFLTALALLTIVSGGLTLAQPETMRDFVDSLVLYRSHGVQIFAMWVAGIVRIGIGIALLYALIRPSGVTREPEVPPEEPAPM